MHILKNQNGFNLFTALIALMLVSITIVFVYNMVQTEENYLSLIQDQSKTSDLMTIADLSRADAFNFFVVSFRERWADYRSGPNNFIVIDRQNMMLDWDSFVEEYANTIFFDNSFEAFFATSVAESLAYTNPPLGYTISIPTYDKLDLARIIRKAFLASDEKIKVIGCETDSDSCLGTLYFKIDTRALSDEDYEKLPMIVVKRNIDDQVIQRPVFARREYRIYLPWRGFQAMRTVRNYALGSDLEKQSSDDIIYSLYNSKGFFNPYINYTLNSAKVGVCDIGSCAPREDLFKTVTENGFTGSECKAPIEINNFKANNGSGITVKGTTINLSSSFDYNLQTPENINPILSDLLITTVKNNLENRNFNGYQGGLELTSGNTDCKNIVEANNGFKICDVSMIPNSKTTKSVSVTGVNYDGSLDTLTSDTFSYSSYNKSSNLGLTIDSDETITHINDNFIIEQDIDNQYLKCHTPSKSSLRFEFNETNPKYIISDEFTNIHVILEDHYSKYSFFNLNAPHPLLNNTGYFDPFVPVNETYNPGWNCNNYEAGQSGTNACIGS